MKPSKRALALVISSLLALASVQAGYAAEEPQAETQPPAEDGPEASAETAQVVAQPSPEELDQLVAPIALYPDALIAQILAAATYPTEIVDADRWMQQNPGLEGDALAHAVDPQSWDPSVKALTQFPSVLDMMNKNLSWTSTLGDAYVNGQQNVLDAVQVMRQRAEQAGNLQSTEQETVTSDGQTIAIEPTDPEVVYVPEYDPGVVYGDPLALYPGWVGAPGAYIDGPGIAFGAGIGIGVVAGFGWGWHHWGTDWHRHDVRFDHDRYISHNPTFVNHNSFDHGHPPLGHPGGFPHGGESPRGSGFQQGGGFPHQSGFPRTAGVPPAGGAPHAGGFAGNAPSGIHSGAFSGFNHGGVTNAASSRGSASVGGGANGGAGFHGGGAAGFHGGGAAGFHGGGAAGFHGGGAAGFHGGGAGHK
jgi:hypothetical protein